MKSKNIKPYNTQAEFEAATSEFAALEQQIAQHKAALQIAINKIQSQYQPTIEALSADIEQLQQKLYAYAQANKQALTQGGKLKTFATAFATFKWRKSPASVQIEGNIEDIIAELKKRRLSRFLRVKTELNKQALLAEADKLAAKPIEGLSIITDKETITISAGGNHA